MVKIKGPLGIWTYPILNILIEMLTTIRARQGFASTRSNIEVWEYTDRKGKKRTIRVHRKVE